MLVQVLLLSCPILITQFTSMTIIIVVLKGLQAPAEVRAEGEIEALRGQIMCPKSPSRSDAELGIDPASSFLCCCPLPSSRGVSREASQEAVAPRKEKESPGEHSLPVVPNPVTDGVPTACPGYMDLSVSIASHS